MLRARAPGAAHARLPREAKLSEDSSKPPENGAGFSVWSVVIDRV